jgi:transitional endoplasmic reticulum ATPase
MTVSATPRFRVPPKLSALLARRRHSQALRFLDRIIGCDYGFLREDTSIVEDRKAALQFKIDLLLELGRNAEALAWLCLETEIDPGNVFAQAMKKRLTRRLNIDDLHHAQPPSAGVASGKTPDCAVDWDGVAGMRELKLTLERDIIMPFLEPEVYRAYRVPLPNGILFYGPPGCGKTFIARKLATMLKYTFIELKPSDLASIYVHGTQEKVGDTFRQAENHAPTVLFFDEIDAFIPSRDHGLAHHYSGEVNEFLAQMNECAGRSILVIGATNYLSRVDVAVRRPGRFDKKILVGPPDVEARVEAVKLYMNDRPQVPIDFCGLLADKELYSFADLELVVNEAAREALRVREPIECRHLQYVFSRIAPSIDTQMIENMAGE